MDATERKRVFREAQARCNAPLYVAARERGISQATLHLWRRYGLVPKRPATREKLAALLGVPVSELEVQNAE